MDIKNELPKILKAGIVVLGKEETLRQIKKGRAKLIVAADNCQYIEALQKYSTDFGVELVLFNGSSSELGAICRKPFFVSSLAVLKDGDSDKVQ